MPAAAKPKRRQSADPFSRTSLDQQVSHVLPLYFQTFVILQQQIKEGLWPATAPIPSENELAERFGVSRVTIRKAMALLEKQNYVLRQRGRGTYVNEAVVERDRRSNFSGLLENILNFQQHTTVKILSFGKVAATDAAAEQLLLKPGEEVLRVVRIRSDGRTPISHVTGFVPYPEAERLKREDLGNSTIISCLEATGLRASSAEQGLSATLADAEIARLMKIEVGAPLISMWRTVKDLKDRPIEYMRTLYRPDRYEYRVVLSRDSVSHSPRWSEVG